MTKEGFGWGWEGMEGWEGLGWGWDGRDSDGDGMGEKAKTKRMRFISRWRQIASPGIYRDLSSHAVQS